MPQRRREVNAWPRHPDNREIPGHFQARISSGTLRVLARPSRPTTPAPLHPADRSWRWYAAVASPLPDRRSRHPRPSTPGSPPCSSCSVRPPAPPSSEMVVAPELPPGPTPHSHRPQILYLSGRRIKATHPRKALVHVQTNVDHDRSPPEESVCASSTFQHLQGETVL